MNYSKVIKGAWNITRKNQKLIWLRGLLVIANLLNFNYASLGLFFPEMIVPEIFSTSFISEIQKFFLSIIGGMEYSFNLGVFIPSFFLYLLSFGLGVFFTPSVLYGLRMAREGETPTYAAIFGRVTQHFKVFLLWSILSTLLMGLLSLLTSLIRLNQLMILSCFFEILFCPIQLILLFFALFVPVLIVLEDRSISSAIRSAWTDFLKPHFWKVVLMYLINGFLGFGLMVGIFLLCIPLFIILYFLSTDGVMSFSTLFALLLAYSPIMAAGFGFLSVFSYGIWIGFYDQIKAIDKVKEEAVDFEGDVEVDAEEPTIEKPE